MTKVTVFFRRGGSEDALRSVGLTASYAGVEFDDVGYGQVGWVELTRGSSTYVVPMHNVSLIRVQRSEGE